MERLKPRRSYSLAVFVAFLFFTVSATQTFGQIKPAGPKAASPSVASCDYHAKLVSELKDLGNKLVELGKAMPAEKFTWHPEGEGLPTVSELYLLAAAEYYHVPSDLGAIRAEPYEVAETPDSTRKPLPKNIPFEKSLTDKTDVTNEVFDAVAYFNGSMESLSDSDLNVQKHMKVRGRDMTPDDLLFTMVGDVHEYLAQAMDYARMNGVVLPWMTEIQQEKQKRGLRAASQPH
jgi:hypothetical protein